MTILETLASTITPGWAALGPEVQAIRLGRLRGALLSLLTETPVTLQLALDETAGGQEAFDRIILAIADEPPS